MEKTMVMKILEQKKIAYNAYEYDPVHLDAVYVANTLSQDVRKVFKTLVAKGEKKYYVFMVPSSKELDLKKVASILIKQKELFPLTGYVHGGCSPIGMKKPFPTFIDSSALNFETIYYSAGKVGYQVETKPSDLINLLNIKTIDLTKGEIKND